MASWRLEDVELGYAQIIRGSVSAQGTEMNPLGFNMDDAYVYELGGPWGRVVVNTTRPNPVDDPTQLNNAEFILEMEELFDKGQSGFKHLKRSYKLYLEPDDPTQYPSRTLNVFCTSFDHTWNVDKPGQLDCTFNFTRRRGTIY